MIPAGEALDRLSPTMEHYAPVRDPADRGDGHLDALAESVKD